MHPVLFAPGLPVCTRFSEQSGAVVPTTLLTTYCLEIRASRPSITVEALSPAIVSNSSLLDTCFRVPISEGFYTYAYEVFHVKVASAGLPVVKGPAVIWRTQNYQHWQN